MCDWFAWHYGIVSSNLFTRSHPLSGVAPGDWNRVGFIACNRTGETTSNQFVMRYRIFSLYLRKSPCECSISAISTTTAIFRRCAVCALGIFLPSATAKRNHTRPAARHFRFSLSLSPPAEVDMAVCCHYLFFASKFVESYGFSSRVPMQHMFSTTYRLH